MCKEKMSLAYITNYLAEREKLFEVRIEVNSTCNLRCEHCYIPNHDNIGLSYDKIINLLYQLRKIGVYDLSFTGGEIFCRKDIFSIIKKARQMGFNVTLFSNITLLDENSIKELRELFINKISCTVFSLDESINDQIMGIEGSLKKIIQNIELLIAYGINVEIKTVLMKKNFNCYKNIQEFCKERKIDYILSTIVTQKNDGNKSNLKLRLNGGQLTNVFKDKSLGLLKKNQLSDEDYVCNRLRSSLFINCKGDVYPCDTFAKSCGNIYENTVEEIWNDSAELKYIRNLKLGDMSSCKGCKKKGFCLKCPGISQLEEGDVMRKSRLACQLADIRYKILKGGCLYEEV